MARPPFLIRRIFTWRMKCGYRGRTAYNGGPGGLGIIESQSTQPTHGSAEMRATLLLLRAAIASLPTDFCLCVRASEQIKELLRICMCKNSISFCARGNIWLILFVDEIAKFVDKLFFCFQVEFAVQQTGFRRVKRGYSPLKVENLVQLKPHEDPTDPYFPFQWYLVSQYLMLTFYLTSLKVI